MPVKPQTTSPMPAYAPVPEWRRISGMGRTRTFEAIRDGRLTAIKCGARTLIDVQAGLDWMKTLPAARGTMR